MNLSLIDIPGRRHFLHECICIEMMGLHQIVQGIAVISKFGIEQADEQVGIHVEIVGKIHGGNLSELPDPRKPREGDRNLIAGWDFLALFGG